MQTIGDLLSRDLTQPIEEVIKLSQQDERTVHDEITQYVATQRIKEQYRTLLQAIADAPGDPHEGVGVWISGFFGSGKSSFAKNLGYVLANRSVLGAPAARLFIEQLRQQSPGDSLVERIADLIDFINKRAPTEAILFDVQVDRAVRRAVEPIAEIMYTVLLRELDYAQDYDLAHLEIELESEGRLPAFVQACAAAFADGGANAPAASDVPLTLAGVSAQAYAVWRRVRNGAQKIQRASAALHQIDPQTYPTPDSWAQSLQGRDDFNIRTLVEHTFELAARRRPGRPGHIVFIIDEVGQYVARSAEKIENLRAVVEHFGKEGKNRVLAGKAVAPVWIIVTSQEKLDEVVAAIDDKRVELAKLQDRFKYHIDMAPADIREVATRRVLAKKPAAEQTLSALYAQAAGQLKTHTRPERTSRKFDVTPEEFVQFYPYLPHFIDLSIDIVSGIRLQPGAPKHIGGSNRTIIKQAYEMLVSDRTALARERLGALVTLDRIFELVEGNLSTEKQKDMTDIMQRWPDDPWPARTAKAIALLEYVRDLPRTETNLAALLYRDLDSGSPLPAVQRSVALLRDAQFIRQTEEGWKLQTAQEKSWAAERNSHNPNPKERHDILEETLKAIFTEPSLSRYNYRKLRNFRVGVVWEGRSITGGEAQAPLTLRVAEEPAQLQALCDATRDDSRAQPHRDEIFWVMCLNDETDDLIAESHRSRRMVGKYEQLRAQNKINHEESASLAAEKSEGLRLEARLKESGLGLLQAGVGFFRGVSKEGATLGKTAGEIFKGMFDYAVPDLYPKLEMGARPLKGSEPEEILKAANLNGLSKIFYGGDEGLELVVKEGAKFVVNTGAPVAKQVFEYLQREHSYGNKVTGRALEDHFGGIGYGWERDMLWLALAALLRAGVIEVTYQGRRFRNHLDPQVRAPFTGVNAFRSASFAPRKAPDLQTLVAAATRYEQLTGEEVDVDESAIAQAFQRLARTELKALLPVEAAAHANRVPVTALLSEYHAALETILNSASDDCVNILTGEGASFQAQRDQAAVIGRAVDEKGLARLRRVRAAAGQVWPLLQAEGLDGQLAACAQLLSQAEGSEKPGAWMSAELDEPLGALEGAYRELYQSRHQQRRLVFSQALDEVKAQPNWPLLPEEMQASTLKLLADRAGHELDWAKGALVCTLCRASMAEMASDLAAVASLRSEVLLRVNKLTAPEEKIERLRVAEVAGIGQTLSTSDEVEAFVEQLRERLLKLIAAGVKVVLE